MQHIENYDNLVQQIISFQNKTQLNFNQKFFFKTYFQSIVDTQFVENLKSSFEETICDGVNLLNFVRICFEIIHHDSDETLYVIIVLIDLYKSIQEDLKTSGNIQYKDILNYITENFFNDKGNVGDYILQQRAIPQKRIFNPDIERVRQIDIDTPLYYGKSDDALRRIIKSRLITDSSHHQNMIKSDQFIQFELQISKINFTLNNSKFQQKRYYYYKLQLVKQIIKSIIIIDKYFYQPNLYSEQIILNIIKWLIKVLMKTFKQIYKIGATLKELCLIFWDSLDNFNYEKKIQISQLVNEHQSQIWYIDFMNQWLTTDHSFAVYGWDIEKETTTFKITLKNLCIDIVELPYIKKVAIGCLDKTLQIWNLMQSQQLMTIDFSQGGIHGMVFNQAYQVILTVGYENIVNITQIDYKNQEHNLVGKLIGHQSMVTAVQCIDKTPMVVTADDCGVIKVWDIRKLNCIQTIVMDSRNVISKILDIQRNLKIGFIGQRVILIEWDQPLTQAKSMDEEYPLRVEFDYQNYQIKVSTQKEVKVLNLINGRTIKIYAGLLQSSTDDISIFRSSHKNKNFIVGDHRGQLKYFNYQTGEHVQNLKGHSNEVSGLKIDIDNQLFISAGWDSQVIIQKQNKNGFEILRRIKDCFHNHEISILELSVQHNLIILASQTSKIYLFDYEFCKLLNCIELKNDNETPIAIKIFNDYRLIMISSSDDKLYVIHFNSNQNNMSFKTVAVVDLAYEVNPDESFQCNKIQMNVELNNGQLDEPIKCSVYLGLMKGMIVEFDLMPIFKKINLSQIKKQNYQSNINLFRVSKKCFIEEIQKQKLNEYQIEDCQEKFQMNNYFKAHKKQITTLKILNLAQKKLMSASQDQFIAIWTLKGECIARLNINHPLPLKWNVKVDHQDQVAKKVRFSLDIVKELSQLNNLSQHELRKIQNVNNLIKTLQQELSQNTFPTEVDIDYENNQILIMQDEYTNKDLQHKKHKQLLQKEIVGPSLKDMEFNKRFNKQENKINQETEKKQNTQMPQAQNFPVDYFQSNYRQDLTFDPNHRIKLEYSNQTQQLSVKLDQCMRSDFKEAQVDKLKDEKQKNKRYGKQSINRISVVSVSNRENILQQSCPKSDQEKVGSFFEYASLRQLDQVEKTARTAQSLNEKQFNEKKHFSQILYNIDSKVKASQQKFKKNPIKNISQLDGDQASVKGIGQGSKKQDDIFQNKKMKEEQEFNKLNQKINNQLDKIFDQAKKQAQNTYQKKQEMRQVLDKIIQTNNCSIEDTMWLYKQKDSILKDNQEFLKGLNYDLVNCIHKDNTNIQKVYNFLHKASIIKQTDNINKSIKNTNEIASIQDEQQDSNNILSFLKD